MSKITVLNEKAIAVEVPKYGKNYMINEDAIGNWLIGFQTIELLPKGSWSILAKGNEMTEEQWRGIVERFNNGAYRDYECPRFDPCDELLPMHLTATESAESLLKSKSLEGKSIIILSKQ